MANDIVHVNLPPGFDPKKHLGALRRRIEQEHGDGFEIRSVNLKKSVATAVRQSAITEVSDDTGKYLEVNLPRDTKPSDGDKIAIQLKATHPGYEMTKFEPFLGTALLTKTDAATSHARASIANALGVKPWEVQVEPRRDGGYNIELPMTYVPSKHDEKLDEVATAMVGKPGWYVKTNALKRTAAIIPSEPPTFPAVIPFPFHDLKNAPRDKLLIGMQLAEPGKDNEPLFLDFEAAPHTQISGTSGSGKAQSVDSLIPVPVSERFPTGWAKVKDLRAGDRLYGKDGEEINLLGLSDELTVDLYEVHLSDGQVVTVGPEHLWRASNARQRNNYRQNDTLQSGDTAAFALRKEYAESLRAYAHQLKPGTFARASDIAKIAKIDEQWVHAIARENDISVEVVYDLREMPVRRRTTEVRHFAADEAFSVLRDIGRGTAMNPDEFIGEWRTAREIAFLTGIGNDKNAARKVTRLLQTRLVPEKNLETVVESVSHKRKVGVKTYPVAEMLDLIAEAHLRNYAEDGIHATGPVFSVISTEEMAKELIHEPTGAHNWSIEVAPAISGRTMDLPVAPYTFGAWLGDGARHSRSIVSIDPEIVEQIVADGYPVRRGEAKPDTDAISYHFDGLRSDLNRIFGTGTIAEKYIPADYLRASYDQRLAVLQGLMDTDGIIDKNGSCELSLSNKRLAEDALELIRSLGIKASCSPSRPASYLNENGEKVECKPRHRIHFTTQLPVFRLPRKAGRLPSEVRETQRHVYVTDIKKVSKGRVKCLRVDAIDGMYLTEGFIQTHNSVTLNTMITGVLAGGAELVIVDLAHKAQPLTTRIPVPISDRFKDGWALLGDLIPGDEVYTPDGSIARVSSLAPIEYDADVYEVEFSDGQVVKADGQHLWPVQNRNDRARLSPSYLAGRDEAQSVARARIEERVATLRELARDAVASKRKANTAGLAELIGKGTRYAAKLVKEMNTPFIEVPSGGTTTRFYSVDEFLTGYIHVLENSVRSGEPVPAYRLETTETIAKNLRVTKKGLLNYSVPHAAPIGGPDLDLPIAPYILGAWLGDGSANSGQITSGVNDADEMAEILTSEWGHPVRWLKGRDGSIATLSLPRPDDHLCPYGHDDFRENTNGTRTCRACLRVGGQDGPKNYSLYSLLEREGLRNNKHIPAEYLRASFEQRLALLQGLMDTDGSVTETGTCRFVASNDLLADGVLELARSLGIAATATKHSTTYTVKNENGETEQRPGRDTNVIQFVTSLPVFRLSRKAERLAARTAKTIEHRFIVDVRKVESEPVRCITIDHPEHLFLTDGFIPTHNSIDFAWVKDYVRDGGWGCSSLEHQVTALALVYEEGQRRAKILAERGVTKWTELPKNEQFKPIFVLLDEVTGLIQMDDKPQGVPKDHPMMQEVLQSNLLRATMLSHMKKIAAEMRFVGIRMVLSSQVSSVNTGIPTALRMNLANKFLLGANPTDGNRRLSLSDPTSVPKVPENVKQDGKAAKGVGVAELEGQPPTVFKSFYAPTEALREALDQLGLPRTSRPEPTAMEIAKHTPSLDDEGPAAAPAYEGERAPSGRPAAEVLAEVKAKEAAAGIAWDNDVDPETGKRLTGYAKANAARHAAKVGGQKPKENLKTKGGDA